MNRIWITLMGVGAIGAALAVYNLDVFALFYEWSRPAQSSGLGWFLELAVLLLLGGVGYLLFQAGQRQYAKAHLQELNEEFQLNEELEKRVTERTQELKDSEGRLSAIVNTAVDGIITINEKGLITSFNPAAEKMFGYSKDEVLCKNVSVLMPSPFRQEHDQYLQNYYHTGKQRFMNQRREVVAKRKDGSVFPVGISVGETYLENERLFTGLIRDITEQKQAQEELVKNQNLLKAIVEGTSDAMFVKDIEGRYLLCNSTVTQMLGKPKEEILYKKDSDLFPPDNALQMRKTDQHILAEDALITFEETIEFEGVHRTFITTKGVYRDEHGKVNGSFGISRDITEQKLMEQRLRQRQKMEAIGSLAGGIAHDFNNLLFGMLGYVEMLQESMPMESRDRKDLAKVIQAGNRAKDLVRQILTFSRQTEEAVSSLIVGPILKEALKLLRSTLPSTIEICTELDSSVARISGNPTQIHQIIMNLCTNASYAMEPNGGILKVGLKEIDIAPQFAVLHDMQEGTYLQLTVSDTGSGMSQETLDRIFEPFFTTKPIGEGTGMGLAVVHGIVKNHGGTIVVKSKEGKGTTFHIFFPIIQRLPEFPASSDSAQSPSLSPVQGRILMVDDEFLITTMLSKFLNQIGFEVISSNNSKKALQLFRKDPDQFDLILTDQTMPHMTGIQLVQLIREVRPSIPIILMTGFDKNLTPERIKQAGVQKFLFKPIETQQLADAIQSLMKSQLNHQIA